MAILTRVKPSEYHDSVTLMQDAQVLLRIRGVTDAAVVMGTPANREILVWAGVSQAQVDGEDPVPGAQREREMYESTAGEHTAFGIPGLDFRGTPIGVDVRKVVRTGILPRLNTGIAHRDPGVGMVGAGLVQAPRGCFEAAFEALTKL
jgi:hypothetical protein